MARTTIRSEDIADGEILVADVADDSITNAKIKSDAAIAATKLSGTLDLSSKTVTLPAASVTAHVTAFEDTPLRRDIATLALQSATVSNQAAYNLSNAFVDVYQDDTGIDAETTCDRDLTGEFMGSITNPVDTWGYDDGITIAYSIAGGYAGSFSGAELENNATNAAGWYFTGGSDATITFDLVADRTVNKFEWYSFLNQGAIKVWKFQTSPDNSTWTDMTSGNTTNMVANGASTLTTPNSGVFTAPNSAGWNGLGFDARTFRYWRFEMINPTWANTDNDASISEIKFTGTVPVANATGNYTSTTQTAQATVSKMGIVVLYKNNAGTATLNSGGDLIVSISANGGTNYQDVTLAAGGTFSTGILIAQANDITVTNTGTAPKYKVSFANQASGSKETQVHGVALLY